MITFHTIGINDRGTCMINHKYRFIFIHIDKTAGTSLLNAINPSLTVHSDGHHYKYKHAGIDYYIKNLENHCEYFKFAFTRNPFDRALSKYFHHFYRPTVGTIAEKKASKLNFNEWVLQGGLGMFRQQFDYIYMNGNLGIDFIGRFENLQQDFNIVCDKIGIPHSQLPHVNKSKHKHYTEYYDDETREIVEQKYAKDIEYFGYKFGED